MAALEALSTNELLNFIMCDSNISPPFDGGPLETGLSSVAPPPVLHPPETAAPAAAQPPAGRKKRRRRPKVCKNKEEAETQRMTHIAVERNRRKQMNEHLAVLRSLMPESYVQRGDQASIVGGAIEFVKELEHILQSLEAKKFALLDGPKNGPDPDRRPISGSPFAQFFAYPQFRCSDINNNSNQLGSKFTCQTKAAVADIEVTLIETHANIRILSRRGARHLSRLVAAFHSLLLTILHLNVTTLDSLVLYSVSAKVEEGCQLNSADDIAGAVHHMLRIMEEEDLGLHV
ncbi:basic helix-loop-helix (bHLH) DNA-bindingsuperfamily protein [Striga asiatica]|uniref:Basic helix-loop-helix (BHLH) DNA-bindingsuperfamily protein n=1 Tax=Striga asiatica TaxID=4170 RepID=A0A5A7PSG8_STRAF|nr:basic helix-loop-helix (bHLH) DNA-bindingsuperfamily protein [Striga asiatica]